jgi:hypothetical protein
MWDGITMQDELGLIWASPIDDVENAIYM